MPKKATSKRTLVDKVREGGFVFHVYDNGETDVYKGTTRLGTLVRSQEKSGRHCFRLKEDRRRSGRQYRGRKKAAEALQIIQKLKKEAQQKKWSTEELIIRAWEAKPEASPR